MNENIKERWVAALRSDEYVQTDGYLRLTFSDDEVKFCPLGVLCDLHSKETGTSWDDDRYHNEYMHLPNAVVDWAGLKKRNPEIPSKQRSISHLNDKYGYNFDDIADLIEKEL